MASQQLIQFLQSTNLVLPKTAAAIADTFSEKEISKKQFLLKEGKVCNDYFFIENGFMRAFSFDTEGNDVTTNFYAANQVVFEVSSFFNRTISKENIQAIADCTGWYITYEQLNSLFHSLPEFSEFGQSVLVRGFTSLKTRMLTMITETAEQRCDALLKTNPEIFQHAALKHIASYLGITDTSLSRYPERILKKISLHLFLTICQVKRSFIHFALHNKYKIK
jgi:CRP-like cAMP-binding protein